MRIPWQALSLTKKNLWFTISLVRTVSRCGKRRAHPAQRCSQGFVIPISSEKKDAAYKFIAWATGKELSDIATSDGIPGSRKSTWNEAKATEKFPQELLDEIRLVMDTGISVDRPLVIHVAEARDAVGKAITTAIEGGDVASELKSANSKIQEIYNSDFKK